MAGEQGGDGPTEEHDADASIGDQNADASIGDQNADASIGDQDADPPVTVRRARPADRIDVRRVLDGADLAVPTDAVPAAITDGDCFVAVPESDGHEAVVGAALLDGEEVVAIAVRRRRRDQRIGSALIAAVADERDRLVATFDGDVRPFYERLGFRIEPAGPADRFRGVLEEA